MKSINLKYFICLVSLLLISGCGKSDNKVAENKTETQKQENIKQTSEEVSKISLPTIQCGTCKKTITKALKSEDGVTGVDVNVDDKFVNVTFDATKTNLEKIEGVIVMAGYQANDKPANKESYDKLESCCKVGGHEK